jgi:hypothetical protein
MLFNFACEAAGAIGARRFLCPLFAEEEALAQLGRIAPRDRGRVRVSDQDQLRLEMDH